MRTFIFTFIFVCAGTSIGFAGIQKNHLISSEKPETKVHSLNRFEQMFTLDARTPGLAAMLKRQAFKHKHKAVPVLIKVMKKNSYPEQNRWHATMLLAQIMGNKSAPFISKFMNHPHWMLRVASLKALLGLKESNYIELYKKALKDSSLIVRLQALDNISQLKIKKLAGPVWNMMYDKTNYSGDKGSRKRTTVVKAVIKTLGDLRYEKAKKPLAKLIQKARYQDLTEELNYSLEKITGKKSPDNLQDQKKFWSQLVSVSTNL